ncbi:MAG: zinc-dependent peptidase [Ilumatobacteraceae bacterium]
MRLFRLGRSEPDEPGLPDGWEAILEKRSAQWRLLDDAERSRLGELADELLATKRWEAARGLELTDEVRTVIAAHAALLVLELDGDHYDQVGTIIVRAGAMERSAPMAGPAMGVVIGDPGAVDGESGHGDGPVMVTWSSARREAAMPRLARDVVLHEFAHKLDSRDGVVDGTPPIDDPTERQRWIDVCTAEYQAVRAGQSVLRAYAGTNPGEFFAVATETFFTVPLDLRSLRPELYGVLRTFYRQDPAARVQARVAEAAHKHTSA